MNPFTIPQLTPAASPDPRPTPELCLLAAVAQMVLCDFQKGQPQAEALALIGSQGVELFCEWLEWDVAWWRKALLHVKDEETQKQRHAVPTQHALSALCAWDLIGLRG